MPISFIMAPAIFYFLSVVCSYLCFFIFQSIIYGVHLKLQLYYAENRKIILSFRCLHNRPNIYFLCKYTPYCLKSEDFHSISPKNKYYLTVEDTWADSRSKCKITINVLKSLRLVSKIRSFFLVFH